MPVNEDPFPVAAPTGRFMTNDLEAAKKLAAAKDFGTTLTTRETAKMQFNLGEEPAPPGVHPQRVNRD